MGLGKLMAEDPTFRVKTDEQTGQVVIAGMGELHLEIIVDRLKREFNVEASVGQPQVAYKETLTRPGRGRGPLHPPDRRPRPVRARRRSASIPRQPARATSFVNDTTGGSIPKEFIKPIDQGIREAMTKRRPRRLSDRRRGRGALRRLYHDVDSSEMAFKIAGSMAFKDAAKRARRCCSSR